MTTVVALRNTPSLSIGEIRVDGGTQSRARINDETVDEYVAAIKGGAKFPPVDVFYDGRDHWMADGFHRARAYRKTGARTIDVRIHRGSKRDALLFSIEANSAHGLRRTNADKRRAVELLLHDEEWSMWSDREIARRAGVNHRLVAEMKSSLEDSSSDAVAVEKPSKPPRQVRTKHGTVTTMNTSAISRANKARSEQRVERDEKIRALVAAGHPACDIARKLGVAESVVGDSKKRQGLDRKNPLAKMIADADGLATAWRHAPEALLAKATDEQRMEAIKQLKATISAARRLIRQLKGIK